jgi:hypothetical protein
VSRENSRFFFFDDAAAAAAAAAVGLSFLLPARQVGRWIDVAGPRDGFEVVASV